MSYGGFIVFYCFIVWRNDENYGRFSHNELFWKHFKLPQKLDVVLNQRFFGGLKPLNDQILPSSGQMAKGGNFDKN